MYQISSFAKKNLPLCVALLALSACAFGELTATNGMKVYATTTFEQLSCVESDAPPGCKENLEKIEKLTAEADAMKKERDMYNKQAEAVVWPPCESKNKEICKHLHAPYDKEYGENLGKADELSEQIAAKEQQAMSLATVFLPAMVMLDVRPVSIEGEENPDDTSASSIARNLYSPQAKPLMIPEELKTDPEGLQAWLQEKANEYACDIQKDCDGGGKEEEEELVEKVEVIVQENIIQNVQNSLISNGCTQVYDMMLHQFVCQ